MKVTLVDIKRVVPYARNPRKNEASVAKVVASLKEFGWRQPIVVNSEMVIVVGHSRLLAAQQLGMEKVPVHVADNLTPAQIKAIQSIATEMKIGDGMPPEQKRDARISWINSNLERVVSSTSDLTKTEASKIIDAAVRGQGRVCKQPGKQDDQHWRTHSRFLKITWVL